jgi:hypothetical protein
LKRLFLILMAAALMAAMMVSSPAPAMADHLFDDEDDGDVIDDVDVEDAFFDGDDVCVLVVIEYEDGSTDVDEECVDIEEASFFDGNFF